MDTGRGVLNTRVYWGEKERASGRGWWGGIAWGEMPNVGEKKKKAQSTSENRAGSPWHPESLDLMCLA